MILRMCNRCKFTVENDDATKLDSWHGAKLWRGAESYADKKLDLCGNCAEEFEKFMRMESILPPPEEKKKSEEFAPIYAAKSP